MADLDRMIEEALDEEDRTLLSEFKEQGFLSLWFGVYRGPQSWLVILATLAIFAMFVAGVYSAWRFFTAADAVAAMRWGAAGWFLLTGVLFMKLWFWMRMESNRVLREVKRVELQLARLQGKG